MTPENDAEGCLQDVHWSEGLFGYFPSYLLGHLISAQISEAMIEAIGSRLCPQQRLAEEAEDQHCSPLESLPPIYLW